MTGDPIPAELARLDAKVGEAFRSTGARLDRLELEHACLRADLQKLLTDFQKKAYRLPG